VGISVWNGDSLLVTHALSCLFSELINLRNLRFVIRIELKRKNLSLEKDIRNEKKTFLAHWRIGMVN
jgi:hypothetical protein